MRGGSWCGCRELFDVVEIARVGECESGCVMIRNVHHSHRNRDSATVSTTAYGRRNGRRLTICVAAIGHIAFLTQSTASPQISHCATHTLPSCAILDIFYTPCMLSATLGYIPHFFYSRLIATVYLAFHLCPKRPALLYKSHRY